MLAATTAASINMSVTKCVVGRRPRSGPIPCRRLTRLGRTPEQLVILPAATYVLGDTDAEAKEYAEVVRRQQVSGRASVRMYRDPLETARQWRELAGTKKLSIRELIIEVTGRQSFVGSHSSVAEQINDLVQADASDGSSSFPTSRLAVWTTSPTRWSRCCRNAASSVRITPALPCATTSASPGRRALRDQRDRPVCGADTLVAAPWRWTGPRSGVRSPAGSDRALAPDG